MNFRRPKGLLIFPHTKETEGETSSTLIRNWNNLLKHALDACDPPIPSEGIKVTNIRHTAFRLTMEEAHELGQEPGMHAFAVNGLTSSEMVRANHQPIIEEEVTVKRTRAKIKSGAWSLQKRVSLEDE